MPEISRFFGIAIKMFFDDHNPPHFHAEYGERKALVDLRNLSTADARRDCAVRRFRRIDAKSDLTIPGGRVALCVVICVVGSGRLVGLQRWNRMPPRSQGRGGCSFASR